MNSSVRRIGQHTPPHGSQLSSRSTIPRPPTEPGKHQQSPPVHPYYTPAVCPPPHFRPACAVVWTFGLLDPSHDLTIKPAPASIPQAHDYHTEAALPRAHPDNPLLSLPSSVHVHRTHPSTLARHRRPPSVCCPSSLLDPVPERGVRSCGRGRVSGSGVGGMSMPSLAG